MAAIFTECRRVIKPHGVMTVMFTHKASGAWDALASGLVKAGFVITASWPINTEAEGSLHIKEKSAAKSTIFLVCRPREVPAPRTPTRSTGRRSSPGSPPPSASGWASFRKRGSPAWICISPPSARPCRSSARAGPCGGAGPSRNRTTWCSSPTRSSIRTPSGPKTPSTPPAAR